MVPTCKFGSALLGYAIHYFRDGGSNKAVVVMHKPNECSTHLIHWKPLHEHAQGAQVSVVTERCICNISDIKSQCSCIHSPNKDLGVEKGGFLELRVLFLSISSLLSILSITHHYQKFCTKKLARSSVTNMLSYIHIW